MAKTNKTSLIIDSSLRKKVDSAKEIMTESWIAGFVDGEGCFNIDVHVHPETRFGLQMQPEFSVVQAERDIHVLHALRDKFEVGSVAVNRKDDTSTRYHFRVKNLQELKEKIIPFFERVPLLTNKQTEFEIFKQIVELMLAKKHNENLEGFMMVLDLAEDLRVRTRTKKVRSAKKDAKVVELRAQLAREKLQKSAQLNQQS